MTKISWMLICSMMAVVACVTSEQQNDTSPVSSVSTSDPITTPVAEITTNDVPVAETSHLGNTNVTASSIAETSLAPSTVAILSPTDRQSETTTGSSLPSFSTASPDGTSSVAIEDGQTTFTPLATSFVQRNQSEQSTQSAQSIDSTQPTQSTQSTQSAQSTRLNPSTQLTQSSTHSSSESVVSDTASTTEDSRSRSTTALVQSSTDISVSTVKDATTVYSTVSSTFTGQDTTTVGETSTDNTTSLETSPITVAATQLTTRATAAAGTSTTNGSATASTTTAATIAATAQSTETTEPPQTDANPLCKFYGEEGCLQNSAAALQCPLACGSFYTNVPSTMMSEAGSSSQLAETSTNPVTAQSTMTKTSESTMASSLSPVDVTTFSNAVTGSTTQPTIIDETSSSTGIPTTTTADLSTTVVDSTPITATAPTTTEPHLDNAVTMAKINGTVFSLQLFLAGGPGRNVQLVIGESLSDKMVDKGIPVHSADIHSNYSRVSKSGDKVTEVTYFITVASDADRQIKVIQDTKKGEFVANAIKITGVELYTGELEPYHEPEISELDDNKSFVWTESDTYILVGTLAAILVLIVLIICSVCVSRRSKSHKMNLMDAENNVLSTPL